jgi:surface protein
MACRRSVNKNNLLRWERVYGGLTIAELQAQGIAALCNPADVAPPFDLVATGGIDQIVLDWQYEGQNDGFIIYRSTDNVTFSILDAVTEAIRDYTDTTATIGIIYYYYIVATNGTFVSAPSNTASAQSLDAFVFEVNTATAGTSGVGSFRPPLSNNATNNNLDVYVDGVNEGKTSTFWTGSVYELTSATLGAAGTKTISLVGTMEGWAYANGGDKAKHTDVIRWGTFNHNNQTGAFYGCSNLQATITATDSPDFTGNGNTTLGNFFFGCTLFNTNIGHWDVSSITSFGGLFQSATAFNQNLGDWDMSNATNLGNMFTSATNFNNGGSSDINNWDISNVTSLAQTFFSCVNFNQPIGNWNTGNVTTMFNMFFSATAFNQDISGWNTGNVTSMSGTFISASSFNQAIGVWNMAKVTTIANMLNGANSFNQNLGAWNTLNTGTRTTITGTTALQSSSTANGISTANYDLFLVGQDAQVGTLATIAWGVINRRYTIGGAGETARTSLIGRGVTFVGDAGI